MKRFLLVSAAFVAMLPMTAFARGRVGVFVGPGFAPYGFIWVWLRLVWSLRVRDVWRHSERGDGKTDSNVKDQRGKV